MNKEEVIKYFGSVRQLAEVLDITVGAVNGWKYVPRGRQFEIEKLTKGELKSDLKIKRKVVKTIKVVTFED